MRHSFVSFIILPASDPPFVVIISGFNQTSFDTSNIAMSSVRAIFSIVSVPTSETSVLQAIVTSFQRCAIIPGMKIVWTSPWGVGVGSDEVRHLKYVELAFPVCSEGHNQPTRIPNYSRISREYSEHLNLARCLSRFRTRGFNLVS
jgi:hypothetical protein